MGSGSACRDTDRASTHRRSYDFNSFHNDRTADHNYHQCGGTNHADTKLAIDAPNAKLAIDSANAAGSSHAAKWNNADHACACTRRATGRQHTNQYSGNHSRNGACALRSQHCSERIQFHNAEFAFRFDDDLRQHEYCVEFAIRVRALWPRADAEQYGPTAVKSFQIQLQRCGPSRPAFLLRR